MNESKVIFATVVIFAAGVIAGGMLVNYVDLTHAKMARCVAAQTAAANASNSLSQAGTNNQPKANQNRPRIPEILSKEFVDRLEFELQLSLGQRADIEKIIADGQDESRKSFQDIRNASRDKIRKQLTPKQEKLFDELLKQQKGVKRNQPNTNSPAASPVTNSSSSSSVNAPDTK